MEETRRDSSSIDLYYAVSGSGQGVVYAGMPVRDQHFKCWIGEIVSCLNMTVSLFEANGFPLPPLKWSDEPVKLELTLNRL